MARIRKGGTGTGHLAWGPFVPISITHFGPKPPIPPEPPVSGKATIISYQTPITLGQTSRAVAKLTQGDAKKCWFQWQYLDSSVFAGAGVWTNANLKRNPATDIDHHYALPHVGNFPIRLQTWDAPVGGTMTDQTGTPRIITVQAVVPPEPPTPIPPPVPNPPSSGRSGIPRGNGFQVIDDGGGYLPWGTSFFWGNGGWLNERQRCQDNLTWAAGQRIDFVRVIATGLKMGDVERSVSPTNPAFQSTIAGLTDYIRSLGMRVQWTIFGATYDAPTPNDRIQTVDLVCEALKGREASVQMLEIGNEAWANGFPGEAGAKELKDLVARAAFHLPNTLIATTCPKSGDDVTPSDIQTYYKGSRATIQTHHYARATNPPDGVWRPTRKPWREQHFAVEGCCLLVQNNEPRGPDSSVTQTHDPLVLAMDACTTWLCGVGSYVLHTGAGIYGVPDPARGRPANLWETTGISQICSGIRTTRSLLPVDLPNWTKHQAKAADAPFSFVDTPQEQFTAAYSATSGNQVVLPVSGVVQATTFTLKTGTCVGKVYDPLTGQVIEVFDKSFHTSPDRPAVIAVAVRQ